MSPRQLAVELLNKTFADSSYSNIQLSHALSKSDLSERDKRLCSALYYGVLERKLTLDYAVSANSSRPVEKFDAVVANILRIGVYQLLYMDSIPDSAAVNESVLLARKMRKTSASGFINAVLRSFIRSGKKIDTASKSVEFSAPEWLIDGLTHDYGEEKMRDLLSDALLKPPVTVRINCSDSEFLSHFPNAEKIDLLDRCYSVEIGDVTATETFKKGLFHVQDLASQLCCHALNPQEGDIVLDICAAPGGKTFTMAELMNGKGTVYAFDLHEKRVKLIKDGAERLSLRNIKAMAGDAAVFNEGLPKFTKILCDVPCSGIGAIRRKPEIKYKNPNDFKGLPSIQYSIAENALNYLEIGGEMVYSTCTLRAEENEKVVERLLKNHPEIVGISFLKELGEPFGGHTAAIFPQYFNSDGFFIAKFKKVN